MAADIDKQKRQEIEDGANLNVVAAVHLGLAEVHLGIEENGALC